MKKWINTRVEYQWDGEGYAEVSCDGYWHEGSIADCKKNSTPPDYAAMADATRYSVDMMREMSDRQMDFTERQYNEMSPGIQEQARLQNEAASEQLEQGREHSDFYQENYRPVEEGLIEDVNKFNEKGEQQRMATQAGADVEQQATAQRGATARQMASMGVNPNSGKFAGATKRGGLATAAVKSGAMTNSRERSRQLGYAKKLDVAGLGRGLTGASTAAYAGGVNAGNSSVGNAMAPANFMQNGMGNAASTLGSASSANMSGSQAILNSQTSWANQQANQAGIGDFAATGLAAWAGSGFA
jgi:hypothetical protein